MRIAILLGLMLAATLALAGPASANHDSPPMPRLDPNRGCPDLLPAWDQVFCQEAHWAAEGLEFAGWGIDVAVWGVETGVEEYVFVSCDVVGGPACNPDIFQQISELISAESAE